jgi:hypothetical protein
MFKFNPTTRAGWILPVRVTTAGPGLHGSYPDGDDRRDAAQSLLFAAEPMDNQLLDQLLFLRARPGS